jgi:IMP dehydrogenase/GMP reductase
MTLRTPLVLGADGLPQQLQAADSILSAAATYTSRSVTNGEGATAIVIGAPVYASAADTVKRAQANAKSTAKLAGLGLDASFAAGATGNIITGGILVATTDAMGRGRRNDGRPCVRNPLFPGPGQRRQDHRDPAVDGRPVQRPGWHRLVDDGT